MKPSSPAEVCSIKSKKHKHFQPFSLPLWDDQNKDREAAFLWDTASQDKPAAALSCSATLYSVYPKEAFQSPSSPRPRRRAGYLSEQPAPWRSINPGLPKAGEKLPHKQQPPVQQQENKPHSEASTKLCNAVSLLVLPGSTMWPLQK